MRIIVTLFLALNLMACANFQSVDTVSRSAPKTQSGQTLSQLDKIFSRYQGSPYRYGGSDANGFDCSGFIGVAFDEAFGITLPRTTEQLASVGKSIRRDQLSAGDIIIFKTSVKQLHAGIYMTDGLFIHASTSKGVVKSSLDNDYWQQRYIKARRF